MALRKRLVPRKRQRSVWCQIRWSSLCKTGYQVLLIVLAKLCNSLTKVNAKLIIWLQGNPADTGAA
ncbi:hypothetical protein CLV58_10793 [Spirosoma oryzae]|uniref:Uncharacterized protein n=1 Tax=Spirosoma oryzae TaxID=1469603 RepID=A0A2T0T2Z2_9BACT|nr:hypothetical protein CLV58_10793 [Spirosoma oryzae]